MKDKHYAFQVEHSVRFTVGTIFGYGSILGATRNEEGETSYVIGAHVLSALIDEGEYKYPTILVPESDISKLDFDVEFIRPIKEAQFPIPESEEERSQVLAFFDRLEVGCEFIPAEGEEPEKIRLFGPKENMVGVFYLFADQIPDFDLLSVAPEIFN